MLGAVPRCRVESDCHRHGTAEVERPIFLPTVPFVDIEDGADCEQEADEVVAHRSCCEVIDPGLPLLSGPVGVFDGRTLAARRKRAAALANLSRRSPVVGAHRVAQRYSGDAKSAKPQQWRKGECQHGESNAKGEIGGPDLAFERTGHVD